MKVTTCLFSFLIIIIVSVILMMFNLNIYLSAILILIGVIGGIAMLFVMVSLNKKTDKNCTLQEIYDKVEENIVSDIENNNTNYEEKDFEKFFKDISPNFKLDSSIKNQNEEEKENLEKEDKKLCPYCKCKYDNDLDKCPNCGAPNQN